MLIDGGTLLDPTGPLDQLTSAGPATDPDGPALVSAAGSLTWRQLEQAATTLATRYRSLGLAAGDRLASLMPNRIGLLVHYLACLKAGLVATPLNYRYTHREIDHALGVSEAVALVAHGERAEDLAASQLVPALRYGVIAYADGDGDGGLAGAAHRLADLWTAGPAPVVLEPPGPDDPAAIFFTSGSTGPANGVTHSHGTLRWMFASVVAAMSMTADDVCMPGSSMSHVGAFMSALSALSTGASVVVPRSYDGHEILPLLRA